MSSGVLGARGVKPRPGACAGHRRCAVPLLFALCLGGCLQPAVLEHSYESSAVFECTVCVAHKQVVRLRLQEQYVQDGWKVKMEKMASS